MLLWFSYAYEYLDLRLKEIIRIESDKMNGKNKRQFYKTEDECNAYYALEKVL